MKGTTTVVPISSTSSCANNAFCSSGDGSSIKAGWTIGGGAEYALGARWSAKVEYLYYALGRFSYTSDETSPAFAASAGNQNLTIGTKVTGSIARAGVNYRF